MILQPVSAVSSLEAFRWNQELIGLKNGSNLIFTTPEKFVQDSTVVVQVYRNGKGPLNLGASNDYTVSESGGVGTGFDTITFNGPAPLSNEYLSADYIAAS
jgi:hypothetical protein